MASSQQVRTMSTSRPTIIPAGQVRFVPSRFNTAVAVEEQQVPSSMEREQARLEREAEKQRVIERARKQRERLEQERIEEARRQAYAQATREYQEKLDTLRHNQQTRCGTCGNKFDAFLVAMKQEIGAQLVDMSIRVAETIVRHQLPDRQMLADIIRETLDPISDLQGAKMRMHPDDIVQLRENRADSPVPMIVTDRVELIPDDTLSSGDLILESCNGFFDSRISQRLALLEKSMKERYRNDKHTITGT
ncbi:MAG: hypothetical protein EOM20_16180 [Spartobacteria bacterium]|nr:hypothetical protein [Spartobacteria bacterium]